MRPAWIQFISFLRAHVLTPLQGLKKPLRDLVQTSDGKVRWGPVCGLALVAVLVLGGMLLGVLQSVLPRASNEPVSAAPAAGAPETQAPQESEVFFKGAEVVLNPSMELTKQGRVPLVNTTNPGVFAEAYTRFYLTSDSSRDNAQDWLDAHQEWFTQIIPSGFDSLVRDAAAKEADEIKLRSDWSSYSTVKPVMAGFTTGVHINHELAKAPTPSSYAQPPLWTSSITGSDGIHLVRTEWIASMTPTRNAQAHSVRNGSGQMELLILCPGAEGFTEEGCRVLDAATSAEKFFSLHLREWPTGE